MPAGEGGLSATCWRFICILAAGEEVGDFFPALGGLLALLLHSKRCISSNVLLACGNVVELNEVGELRTALGRCNHSPCGSLCGSGLGVCSVWRLNEVINFEQPLGIVFTRPEARFGEGLYIASLRSAFGSVFTRLPARFGIGILFAAHLTE